MRRLVPLGLVLLVACAGPQSPEATPATVVPKSTPTPSPTPPARDLTGAILLTDPTGFHPISTSECIGTNGYDDIAAGTAVVVKDGSGTIIATAQLAAGTETHPYPQYPNVANCRFAFLIPRLPVADFYSIEVGHRGGVTKSRSDLEAEHFDVELSLGV